MSGPGLRHREGVFARRPAVVSPELRAKIDQRERAASVEFRGVATSDGLVPGLFPLASTGIDMTPVLRAVENYLGALSPDQLAAGMFPIDHGSWRHWTNGARDFLRHGVCLEDLSDRQRELVLETIRSSLSQAGFGLVSDLMHLNRTIGEIRDELHLLNEWLYWFSIYGNPDRGQAWGWQLDGHHVNVNCVFVNDQMVLTPTFLGAEPVAASTGRYAGTKVFRAEEATGLRLFESLDRSQQAQSRIAEEMPADLFTGAFRDNFELNYEGIRFDQFSSEQQSIAVELLGLYVGRARDPHAEHQMGEVLAHAGETYFSWVGETTPDGVFYYRIHSPVILIEFEHQAGVMFDNDERSRKHIHTVVRTPNGNDYGVDWLRQHHEHHHHGAAGHHQHKSEDTPQRRRDEGTDRQR